MLLDRRHVLPAAVIALLAWLLVSYSLPSLRYVPLAFVSGALTTVAGLLYITITTSRGVSQDGVQDRSRISPAPAFTRPGVWEEEKDTLKARAEYRRPIIFPEAPVFSKAVDQLLNLVLRDFVTSWYRNISPRPLFQNEIDRCIRSALLTTAARFTDLSVVDTGMSRVLPIITAHLKEFYDAERAIRGKDLSSNVTESDELDTAIAAKYKGGHMHYVAVLAYSDTLSKQRAHLRAMVAKILPIVLPENMKSSPAVLTLTRELVACAVLQPIFSILQDPDFWNQMIVNFGGPLLQDRKSVRKIREALDQHAPASTPKGLKTTHIPRLRPYDNERQFERFIRAIRNVTALSEARRLRNEVVSQIRKDSAVEGQDAAYLRRLDTGKRLLDQKILTLSSAPAGKPKLAVQPPSTDTSSRKRQASLREVIYDASGLSYFMEYMDRVKLMTLVQYFLAVDSFRDPLEGDYDDRSKEATEAERMDISLMHDGYLTRPELQTPEHALQAVRSYMKAGKNATSEQYVAARQAVLQTQTRVFNTMKDRYFGDFKRSDLYYKWLAIDDNPAVSAIQSKQTGLVSLPDMSSDDDAVSPSKAQKARGAVAHKQPELRRAVLSSTDLTSNKSLTFAEPVRRSSEDDTRPSLFGDDSNDQHMVQSMGSLRDNDSDTEAAQRAREEAKAVSAMQLALDDIVGNEEESLFSEPSDRRSEDSTETRSFETRRSADMFRPPLLTVSSGDRGKPSIASLGLVGAPQSRGVFVDDLFGEEAERFAEDEKADSEGPSQSDDEQVQEAAPGDLGLTEAIGVLSADIERLHAQKHVLDSLTSKAELTNNTAELRILRKSEQSLQREIHRKEMQKQQYIVQESDNSLYGRASIAIKSVMVGREEDGHEYAMYVIEVRRQAGDQMPAATWAVTRRYSQFHELHKRLRMKFPLVKDLDFPRRQTLFTLQKDFIQKRRTILERYLRSLLKVPAICRSRELRAFLSQSAIASGTDDKTDETKDFVSRIYNSVSDGMEDFLGNIPVLDQLSVAGQNLISAATAQMSGGIASSSTTSLEGLDPAVQDPSTAAEAEAELNAYEAKEAEPFVKPICDLFLETFELSKGNSWLRGRTVVVILHQLLGGTIERKVRDTAKASLEDENLSRYIELLKSMMWPDGKLRQASAVRTAAEKARTRKEAGLILGALIPDMAGSVVGKAHAQAAARKIVALLNNRRLNTHLVFSIIDEVIRIVFPETQDK